MLGDGMVVERDERHVLGDAEASRGEAGPDPERTHEAGREHRGRAIARSTPRSAVTPLRPPGSVGGAACSSAAS